jgi:hypothetical protein
MVEKRTKEECLKACETNKWAYLHINCVNMKGTHDSFDGEYYSCSVCYKSYWLDYDEMR